MYKCTVISLASDEPTWGPVFEGDCENLTDEEVDNQDISDVNDKLINQGFKLVGNFICDAHAEMVGDI